MCEFSGYDGRYLAGLLIAGILNRWLTGLNKKLYLKIETL